MSFKFPRMVVFLVITVVLIGLTLLLQSAVPGNLLSVTLYKAHLMALGGWGGYWLDRALFPYDRPHTYLFDDEVEAEEVLPDLAPGELAGSVLITGTSPNTFGSAMMRRAIIVAACLICVGLGA